MRILAWSVLVGPSGRRLDPLAASPGVGMNEIYVPPCAREEGIAERRLACWAPAAEARRLGGPDQFSRELGFADLIAVHRGLRIRDEQRPSSSSSSAATPPGPGVHGMSGYNAAQSVLRALRR